MKWALSLKRVQCNQGEYDLTQNFERKKSAALIAD